MVYGIMQKHEGSIVILNTDTSGTTMRINLPPLTQIAAPDNTANQSLPFGGNETILVVEDEKLVAKITRETLEKAGYTVVLATNGEEAIECCANDTSIQLIFMDVVMPKMGGPEAASIIRKTRPKIPILFTSGYAPDSYKAIQNDYTVLNKPYRGDDLLNSIRTLLDNESGS